MSKGHPIYCSECTFKAPGHNAVGYKIYYLSIGLLLITPHVLEIEICFQHTCNSSFENHNTKQIRWQ